MQPTYNRSSDSSDPSDDSVLVDDVSIPDEIEHAPTVPMLAIIDPSIVETDGADKFDPHATDVLPK